MGAEAIQAYQYKVGHKEADDVKRRRIEAFTLSWKNRESYIQDIKHPYIHNVWRSFKFTLKGKRIGYDPKWNDYRLFYNDVFTSYVEGYKFQRLDKTLPFSPTNFIWISNASLGLLKSNAILLAFQGEILTINEWAEKLNVSAAGIRLRYHRNKNYSTEEVLLGKKKLPRRLNMDAVGLVYKKLKDKASKMCSSYRIKDRRRRFESDLNSDWLIENILFKRCTYCGTDKYIGCDRIDNKKGHTKDNVVPCCPTCNMVRGNSFTVDEMKIIGKCISEIIKNR